jgi:hypothetical protein
MCQQSEINKVTLTADTENSMRLEGSVLDGLPVLAWQPPHGRRLLWMCEMGKLNVSKIAGFIMMNFSEVAGRSEAVARRALLTNSLDIARTLEQWEAIGGDRLPALTSLATPELIWLGVRQCRNALMDAEDIGLPQWALGHEIIEVDEPYGCFAALGYCRRGEDAKFKVATKY